jgi:hypothetical protein
VRKSAQKEGKGKKTVRPLALSRFIINSFSVKDFIAQDAGIALRHRKTLPTRTYPALEHAGTSRYLEAVDAIASRYMPASVRDLDDDEYDRRLDQFYGIGHDGDHDEEPIDNAHLKILDAVGIWEAIRAWMLGTMDYPTLLELIDFQYDANPKIQYWEDFISKLTFIDNLDKREELFLTTSLADHLALVANYHPLAEGAYDHPHAPPSPTLSPENDSTECTTLWAVTIIPRKYSLDGQLVY